MQNEQQNLWPWILWRIWKLRNELVYQSQQPDIVRGYNLALTDHYEWLKHTTSVEQPRVPPPLPLTEAQSWIPPSVGRLKCNTDATWKQDTNRCGVAWVLRDETGAVKFWGVKTFPRSRSVLEAEATALLWAVSCIDNMGYRKVDFETDSSSVVEALKHPQAWPRLLSFTTEFHEKSTRDGRDFKVHKVSRERNKAADYLARFAQEQVLYFGSIYNLVPLWLQPFLDAYFV